MSNRVIIMREAVIRIVKMLSLKDVRVTQRGSRAFVEYAHTGRPTRVNIPYIPDDASEELLDAIQGFIDHEVAHILFTDYRVLAKAKKMGLANLHNIIEDSFIERKMAQHFAGSGLNLQNTGNFFLKTYTDVELKKNPGNAEGLLFVPAVRCWAGQTVFKDYMADKWHMLAKITAALGDAVKEVPLCATSDDCLTLADKFRKLLEVKKPKAPKPPKPSKTSDDELEDDELEDDESMPVPSDESEDDGTEPSPFGDSEDMPEPEVEGDPDEIPDLDVGDYTADDAERSAPSESDAEDDDAEGDESDPVESAPDHAVGDDSDDETPDDETPDLTEVDHAPVGTEGGPDEDGEEEDPEPTSDEGDEPLETPSSLPGSSDGADGEEGDDDEEDTAAGPSLMEEIETKMGKEYDDAVAEALSSASLEASKAADYLVYTTELDVIEPMPVGSHLGSWNDTYLKTMTDQVDHLVGPLQKDLERAMAARSAATWSAGHRSGRLNPSALARLTTFNDDRAFRRKHINESKDIAVELLVDCSASMGGSKIRTAAYSAYGLSAVLDRMGIQHEVMGFTTQDAMPAEMRAEASRLGIKYARNETLYHPILKSFNERLTTDSKRRFAALPTVNWLCENVDGESVQIAAQRLAVRREKRKILMVLSDGQPACPGDWKQLQFHLKKSVRDVEKSGIEVIGIGIQSDAPKHFYSKYVLLDSVAELPNTVIGELKRLLMKP